MNNTTGTNSMGGMNMGMQAIYWYKNQVAITYHADLAPTAPSNVIATKITAFRQQINQQVLATANFQLLPYSSLGIQAAASTSATNVLDDLNGVYLFGRPPYVVDSLSDNSIMIFYHIAPTSNSAPPMGGTMPSSGGNMGGMNMGNSTGNGMNMGGMGGSTDDIDNTLTVISFLQNNPDALKTIGVTSYSAMPHWLGAGTDFPTHGCPLSPPIPVNANNNMGKWKLNLQQLSNPSLQVNTGNGVTIFVLDTLPALDQIMQAANAAGNSNALLQDMVNQYNLGTIIFNHQDVPPPSQTAITGKDIYGHLVGFPMADHGLFIAGMIHDLAPNAKLECVRVLNDCGVGDLNTLAATLNNIYHRMSQQNPDTGQVGDLFNKPVVINMSLVIGPPESDMPNIGLLPQSSMPDGQTARAAIRPLLQGFQELLQNLQNLGAIFVASAGNDTDPRDTAMNPTGQRIGPRFPAAFANDETNALSNMIPVAALNQQGQVSSYSNHPGPNGIATYGGEPPVPTPATYVPGSNVVPTLDPNVPIEAPCGIYTSPMFPALADPTVMESPSTSVDPATYPEFARPNTAAWAYWSGTSFATPIISALAALVLEGQSPGAKTSRADIIATTSQTITWTNCNTAQVQQVTTPMLMANQSWQASDALATSQPSDSTGC